MSNPLFDDFFNLDLLTPSDTALSNNDLFSFFLDNNDTALIESAPTNVADVALSTSTQTQTLDLNALLAAHRQSQKEEETKANELSTTTQSSPQQQEDILASSFTQKLVTPTQASEPITDFSTLAILPTSAIPASPAVATSPTTTTMSPIDVQMTASVSDLTTVAGVLKTASSSSKRPSPERDEGARKHAKKEKAPPKNVSSTSSSKSTSSATLDKDDSLVNTTLSAATLQFLLQKQMEAPLIPQLFTETLSREQVEDTLAKLLESTKHLLQPPSSSSESHENGDDDGEGHSSEGENDQDDQQQNEPEKITPTTHGGLKTQPGIKTDDIPSSSDLKKMTSRERRQLRNKISARNFRIRRKEYIGALEGQVLQHRTDAAHLREAVTIVNDENKRLKDELDQAKSQLTQATISNSSTAAHTSTATIAPLQTQQAHGHSSAVVTPTPVTAAAVTAAAMPSLSKDDQMLLSAILGRSPFSVNAKTSMTLTLPTRPQSPIVTFNSQKDLPNSSTLAKSGSWKDKGPMFVHSALVPELRFGQEFQFTDKPLGSSFGSDANKPWELLWSKNETSSPFRQETEENPFAMQSVVFELMQTFTMAMAMGITSPEEMDACVSNKKKMPGWMVVTDAKANVQDYEVDKRATEALEWELQQTLWEVVEARDKSQKSKEKRIDPQAQYGQEDACMLEWLYESMMAGLVALDTQAILVPVHSA
ncbi:hypothetical protein BG004_004877 [Podila humilis]|nr:hypothetical protein BG004_004877 [Podila humilis]